MTTLRILVVEDEPAIRELIGVTLKHAGFHAILTAEASEAQRVMDARPPDLIVLDWMLPQTSGIAFAKSVRQDPKTRSVPIVLLTARADEGDRLQGFDAGVDDYVTKPFSPRELVARIKAVMRRANPNTDTAPLEIGDLKLDPNSHRVTTQSGEIKLGPTEFRLLHFLMKNTERVWSRDRLLSSVWEDPASIEERTVDVHVRRLRQALELTGHDHLIETVRGTGYRMLATVRA